MARSNVASLADWMRPAPVESYDDTMDAVTIEQPDGGVIIQFNPGRGANDNPDTGEDDHFANLAMEMDAGTLGRIAWEIIDGVQNDETSRTQWVSDRARGLDLLAIKQEQPRSDVGGAGAPMEGMSTVRHPLLLEACIRFQSNTKRELLPANGPVKVKNEGIANAPADQQAEDLGELLNRYFTEFAPEYYPDTDRMFFDTGFSGMGFKKCHHDPIRRRPVSDSVPSKDLIVSNDAVDLVTATRVTHQISMTRATLKRMQFVGAYRDVALNQPDNQPVGRIKQKEANIQGIDPTSKRTQDQQYTIYECYTALDLPGYEHTDEDGEPTGLPLPYKITVDRASRQILEIRRNWDEDDENFEKRTTFVAYPFVPMFGFYATGLLHILGNTTSAVTGAWRILLDSGMFANFPGFLYAKSGGRQDDLNFRIPPGGGAAVDMNGSDDLRKTIMALPYKDPGGTTMTLVDNIISTGQRIGGTAELISQDGMSQNVPVGTTMAIVEQAAQTISAVHERMFVAQSQEFQLMLRLFREDPESLWRFIQRDGKWTLESLTAALEAYNLVPVADPNTPTHVHRIMKMTTLKQLQMATPGLYNVKAVDERILRAIKIDDPESLWAPPAPPGAAPPDPAVIIAEATKQTKMADIQSKQQIEQMKLQHATQVEAANQKIKQLELELKAAIAERADKTKLEVANINAAGKDKAERIKLAAQVALSPFDDENHEKALELKKAGPPKTTPAKKD